VRYRLFRISAANIGPNRFHQNRTVSWLMSIPRSANRSSTLRSDNGYFTYIITTRRITSGELFEISEWVAHRLKLPQTNTARKFALTLPLGTLALFRGFGYIILGSGSVNEFPDAFTDFGIDTVGGSVLPWTIVPFLILAPIFAVLLQKGAIGRRIYAIGGSPDVARYAGVRVGRIRLALFATSGVISALAGVVFTARLANARADNAVGLELDVITIALLGGVSVFGGRGHLTGVFFALVLIAALRNILGLLQIGGNAQGTVIGLLLIGSLLLSTVTQRLFASASAFLASPDSGGSKPGDPPEARSSPTIGA
jgi:ABC-type uncharacterized transport system permease subunit